MKALKNFVIIIQRKIIQDFERQFRKNKFHGRRLSGDFKNQMSDSQRLSELLRDFASLSIGKRNWSWRNVKESLLQSS